MRVCSRKIKIHYQQQQKLQFSYAPGNSSDKPAVGAAPKCHLDSDCGSCTWIVVVSPQFGRLRSRELMLKLRMLPFFGWPPG